MPVVHSIVTDYGGAIEVQSSPGKGSVFEVFLPVYMEEHAVSEEVTEAPVLGKGRILFVDDERMITQGNKDNLEKPGFRVVTENDPVRALSRFEVAPNEFDLVITDVSMPRMDGLQLSANISRIRKGIPIILFTGYSHNVDEKNPDLYGIAEPVYKPVRSSALAAAIVRVMKDRP